MQEDMQHMNQVIRRLQKVVRGVLCRNVAKSYGYVTVHNQPIAKFKRVVLPQLKRFGLVSESRRKWVAVWSYQEMKRFLGQKAVRKIRSKDEKLEVDRVEWSFMKENGNWHLQVYVATFVKNAEGEWVRHRTVAAACKEKKAREKEEQKRNDDDCNADNSNSNSNSNSNANSK